MKMTAAGRLVFGTVLLAVVGVGSGLVALGVNRYLGSLLEQAVTVGAERQALAGKVSAGAAELMALDRGLAFAMVLQQGQEASQMQGKLESASSQLDQVIERYSAIAADGVRGELSALKEQQRDVAKLQGEVIAGLNQQRMDQALGVLNASLLPRLESMGRTAKQLVAREQEALSRHEAESQSARSWSLFSLVGLILVSFVISVLVVQWIVAMMRNLRRVLGELNGQANQVNKMSAEISESAEALSRSASEQAASLDETSASSEEIHVMTRRSAENAKEAAAQMGEASGLIEDANDALRRMVASMNEISSSSGKISKIIRVIDEIAFQTNILALNAAVEAARAGEAGMGFAVVADEVRSLAQRSAQAASDTTQLIEESIRSASEGKRKLDEVAQAIAAVTDRAKSAKGLVDHVHVASEEQERGIEQIAKSVARMGEVTQQVASTAEQSASAGRLLREQASSVDSMVASLRGMVGEEVRA